jgi:hypothetical protein
MAKHVTLSTDPWATPLSRVKMRVKWLPTLTLKVRREKKSKINVGMFPRNPHVLKSCDAILCRTALSVDEKCLSLSRDGGCVDGGLDREANRRKWHPGACAMRSSRLCPRVAYLEQGVRCHDSRLSLLPPIHSRFPARGRKMRRNDI